MYHIKTAAQRAYDRHTLMFIYLVILLFKC